jgi:hypothetical protein
MQSEEQQLIDGLFDRLKQAESQTGARDHAAEQRIQARIREQPAAPYYMAQSIIIQEAALKRMDQRVKALEAQVNALQQQAAQPQQSSGGFLSSLFGGGHRSAPAPQQNPNYQAAQQNQAAWNNAPQQPYSQQPAAPVQAAPSRAGSFIGGALQTAAGVAGGVMLADMLTGMFHHSQPEEIVNIINNDDPMPVNTAEDQSMFQEFDESNNLDTFNGTDDRYASNGFLDNQNDTFGSNDSFGDDSFNDDDDSFL